MVEPATPSSTWEAFWEAVKTELLGGPASAVMSALIAYFIIGMPARAGSNALGNGISGLMSGVIATTIDLMSGRRENRQILASLTANDQS